MSRALGLAALLACLMPILPTQGTAQRRQPDTVFSVDGDWFGAAVNYAREQGPGRYRGLEAGVGGGFWNHMLAAGDHFTEEKDERAYPAGGGRRDGRWEKDLIELLHVAVFLRNNVGDAVSWDVGGRASLLVHQAPVHDRTALPVFLGGYTNVMVGNRWIKAGPRLLVGLFAEGDGVRELGVYLVPLTVRVSFGW